MPQDPQQSQPGDGSLNCRDVLQERLRAAPVLIASSRDESRVNDFNAQSNWQSRSSTLAVSQSSQACPSTASQGFPAAGAGGISRGGEEGPAAAVLILLFPLPASFVSFH